MGGVAAVGSFEAVAVVVVGGGGGGVVGVGFGFGFGPGGGFAGDPLEEFGHDGGAGAEDDGGEFADAGGRSQYGWGIWFTLSGEGEGTYFQRPTLMME